MERAAALEGGWRRCCCTATPRRQVLGFAAAPGTAARPGVRARVNALRLVKFQARGARHGEEAPHDGPCALRKAPAPCSAPAFSAPAPLRGARARPRPRPSPPCAGGAVPMPLPGDGGACSTAECPPGWQRRWTIVALCAVAFLLCNLDRVNMSVAILPMSQQFGWTPETMGLVQSSFFWGYLLTQVAGGVLADRIGGKSVLGFGVMWWSLATVVTPIAAQAGLWPLLAVRAMMGVGEGVALPAMNAMVSKWVPCQERARSLAFIYSGMYTGSMIGLAASPAMCAALGWQSVFLVFGSMGAAWFWAWQKYSASNPTKDDRLSPEEAAYIRSSTLTSGEDDASSIPWRELLSKPAVWAIIISHFCHNWGTFILLTWMPTYYSQVLGLNLAQCGMLSVLPWATMALMANVGGAIADGLQSRGWSITSVRRLMQTIGFLGPALFLSLLPTVNSAWQAVVCMMGAQGLDAFSQSGLYSNHADIGPKYAGVLLGLSNTAGVLAGVLGTAAVGFILANGSWADVWRSAVFFYLAGTVVWNTMSTGERVI
ncbi:unnamed protein product [Pedinophyceae sp. YPF-701]|nr:unnamed protein product [Pedinophyceae sp. YPF-701]